MSYLNQRKGAFMFAFSGLLESVRREAHMKIHLAAAIIIFAISWLIGLQAMEWLAVIFCSGLVMVAELFNTAVEKICDMVHPEPHATIKYIKDISAGAVLISCIVAVLTACFVFIPYFL